MIAVRDATEADAAACAAVYRPYVSGTAITFETDPPDAAAFAARIRSAQERHAWLVAEADDALIGYAYGTPFRPRAAYAWSCETTVYLREGIRRTGAGRALLVALLARLEQRGQHSAIAAVALPNPASIGLHEALGFRHVGVFERVGWKLDAWHDVAWLQKDLRPPGPPAGS